MGYGVEIWKWKERRYRERSLRWILGGEKRTSGYLVRGEMQREMMRIFGKEMEGRTDGRGL